MIKGVVTIEDPREITIKGILVVLRDDDTLEWVYALPKGEAQTVSRVVAAIMDAGYKPHLPNGPYGD